MSGQVVEIENRGQPTAANMQPQNTRTGQDGEDKLDLREYLRVILKHRWSIAGITLLVTLLSVFFVLRMTPIYSSTASILIESDKTKVVSIEEFYNGMGTYQYYETQYEILRSRDLAEKLVDRLKLEQHPEFAPKPKEKESTFSLRSLIPASWRGESKSKKALAQASTQTSRRDAIINAVRAKTSIEPVEGSQLVMISFESNDPKLAAAAPNALADLYIESDLEAGLQMKQKASSWLTERLAGLRTTLEASERALQQYREKEQLVDVKGVRSVSANQLDDISRRLIAAQQKYQEALNVRKQVNNISSNNISQLETIPAVLSHSLIQGLKRDEAEIQQKVSELAKRYGPLHPKMQAARSELQSAQSNLRRQIQQVVQGIEKEYQVARDNAAALRAEMARVKEELNQINRKEYELTKLERDVETNRELYNLFLTRLKETGASSDFDSAIARVIDPAVVPLAPSKPHKKRIVAIVFLLTLLASIGLAFLYEYLDNTFKGTEDVERKLGLAVLGALPLLKTGKEDPYHIQRQFLEDEKSGFSEAVRTIRTGLMLSAIDEPHKVVVMTSTIPSEGKSTLTMNLGLAMAKMGKVLIIEADMRRPTLARVLGLDSSAPGLSALVAGTAKISECVHEVEGSSAHIMTCGVIPPNPLELLSSERFKNVIEQVREMYDWVIIDSAPAQAVSDALVLSTLATSVVYVVKADSTPYPLAQRAIKRLRAVNAPLLGVAMNHVEQKKGSRYHGKYSGYYGKYSYYDSHDYGYHSEKS